MLTLSGDTTDPKTVSTVSSVNIMGKNTKLQEMTIYRRHMGDRDKTNIIVTGDLKIITDSRIRSIICKGPKYRFPVPIDFKSCREEIL